MAKPASLNNKLATAIKLAMVSTITIGMANYSVAEETTEESNEDIEQVVVVGSRAAPRSVGDSPVPVDVLSADEFGKQGVTDMNSLLAAAVPSYNVNAQPISDAATLVRPANLRGLSPDSTLILVNGKRRHRASVISFLGGGISDGAQGPDVSVIPSIALKQVEVLRDGAAAQYGSDAIAGVINFVLKDDSEGGSVEFKQGVFAEGDGESSMVAANIGMPFTDDGFANFSYEYLTSEPTSRSIQRDDADSLRAAGNSNVSDLAQIWGSPEIKQDFKFFGNIGLDLGDDKQAYMFGNWAEREAEGGFYFRNPNTRGGVYSADEGATLLVGDLRDPADPNFGTCSTVNISGNAPVPAELAVIEADPNCFAFNEMIPGGFTPRFGGIVKDASLVGGVKGIMESGILWDFSASYGRNSSDFFLNNTVNASLGPDSPRDFSPGSYIQTERGLNLDLSYPLQIESFYSANLAGGIEYRHDMFEIIAGDAASFAIGPLASQGFGIGSNGFPGFKPQDAGEFERYNKSAYIDFEADVTEDFLFGAAARYEDFSDFGSTTNGKLSVRYQATDAMAVRSAVSTGFRAPTVGQSNVRNVTTAFTNGQLEDQATLPPTNPISLQKGGKALEPELSTSFSFGTVIQLDELSITADYFDIAVKDRISQTGTLDLTAADITALQALGIRDASSFSSVKFFTNDFDTRTTGLDLVVNYDAEWFGGDTKLAFAYNKTQTEVTDRNPDIIDDTKVRLLEENLPQDRMNFTASQFYADFNALLRVNYYGEYFEAHLDDGSLPLELGAETTMDVEFGYTGIQNYNIIFGIQNLTDNYPDDNPYSGIAGAQYPTTSPMGFNGRYTYMKLGYEF